MKRRGFTIVELMMVIAVIAVLITICSSAVIGVLQRARVQRAQVLCRIVEQGLSTYYAQKGSWPWGDKQANDNNHEYYELSASEVKDCIFMLVKESKQNHNPMFDISGLLVSVRNGEPGDKHHGMDFMTAVRGSKQHPRRIPAGQLYYGYPESSHGYFRRFIIKYSPSLDRVSVSTFPDWQEGRANK